MEKDNFNFRYITEDELKELEELRVECLTNELKELGNINVSLHTLGKVNRLYMENTDSDVELYIKSEEFKNMITNNSMFGIIHELNKKFPIATMNERKILSQAARKAIKES